MTLETGTAFNGLAVCSKCGWPVAGPAEVQEHTEACPHVEAGTSAAALAARVDEVASTKFGYGTSQLTFETDRALHVRFECNRDGTFHLNEVWLLDDLTQDEAADLVRSIAAWRRGCTNMRRR